MHFKLSMIGLAVVSMIAVNNAITLGGVGNCTNTDNGITYNEVTCPIVKFLLPLGNLPTFFADAAHVCDWTRTHSYLPWCYSGSINVNMDEMELTGCPDWSVTLPDSVQTINFEYNGIDCTNLDLTNLPNKLDYFRLNDNAISGTVAWPVGSISGVTMDIFDISENSLEGYANLSKINSKEVHIGYNKFTSLNWAMHNTITDLWANGNSISGSADLTNLPSAMQSLNVYGSQLSGTIDLTMIPNTMTQLTLTANNIVGPVDFTSVPQTTVIYLDTSVFCDPFVYCGGGTQISRTRSSWVCTGATGCGNTCPCDPTASPTVPQTLPTFPTVSPTVSPTLPTMEPSAVPSAVPSDVPSAIPTLPTNVPSAVPTDVPSDVPSDIPTLPTNAPSDVPSAAPTFNYDAITLAIIQFFAPVDNLPLYFGNGGSVCDWTEEASFCQPNNEIRIEMPNANLIGCPDFSVVLADNVTYIDLSDNFIDCVDIDLSNLPTDLSYFSIARNRISGSVTWPTSAQLRTMDWFDISENRLIGDVSLSTINSEWVSVAANKFTTADWNVIHTNIRWLDASQNMFSGSVDLTTLGDSLLSLNLAYNSLSGSVILSNLPTAMEYLNLENNLLSGVIECCSALPLSMTHLYLAYNDLSGVITLTNLPSDGTSSQYLDLRQTNIDGPIDFSSVPYATTVYLDKNVYCDTSVYCNSGSISTEYRIRNFCRGATACAETCECVLTIAPTAVPSAEPTVSPTAMPIDAPTTVPSAEPTLSPTVPTVPPTAVPSSVPSTEPTVSPVTMPTDNPTDIPTSVPSNVPSNAPTQVPTISCQSCTSQCRADKKECLLIDTRANCKIAKAACDAACVPPVCG